MKKLGIVVVVLALAAGAWLWLGRGTGGADGGGGPNAPLSYVPADTPYVFANLEPLPKPVIDKAMLQSAEFMGMYKTMFADFSETLAKSGKDEDKRVLALFEALVAEFDSKTPQQIVDEIGFGTTSRFALYGIGVVPVMRSEVASPDNLRGFIARMEKVAGETLPIGKLETLDYWMLRPEGAPLMGIAAIIDNHFVLTLAPADADAAVLRTLFGLDKPARSLLDSGSLAALNKEYGFLPYMSGYLDSARFLAALKADSLVDRAFLAAMGTSRPELDPVCSKEFDELAVAWPRMAVGYEVFDTNRNVSRFVLETRPDIATELMKLRAPMPGLGQGSEATLVNIGASMNLSALPGVVGSFAGKVRSAPWQCEELTGLNKAFEEAGSNINNPAVFAAAPVFSGLHILVNTLEMDFSGNSEPGGTGVLLIGSDNPASLLAMAKGFVPQIASVDLPADRSVVALPAVPGLPAGQGAHAASSDKVIGIGIGGDEVVAALPGLLVADPAQQPLFVAGVSSAFYAKIADMMEATAETSSDGDPAQAEMIRKQAGMMRTIYSKLFTRVDMRLELSEKGIEFRQTVLQP